MVEHNSHIYLKVTGLIFANSFLVKHVVQDLLSMIYTCLIYTLG